MEYFVYFFKKNPRLTKELSGKGVYALNSQKEIRIICPYLR